MPATPNGVRAQIVFQGVSGLPEDRYVNTWHFQVLEGETFESVSGPIAAALFNFYDADPGPGTGITPYMALNRFSGWECRLYNLEDAEPRSPTVVAGDYPFNLIQGSTSCMPDEVALCMSFHGDPPVTARRRGRIYLGPFNNTINASGGADPRPTPATAFKDSVLAAATTLLGAGGTDFEWCVYSPTTNALVPVVGGWVDDAFDTQRRRGRAPELRYNWPA